jgi:hypothetical protein
MATKIIQNLEFLNSFGLSSLAFFVFWFFSFFQIGSGAYPYHPRPREGRLPIGVSACPQLGPGFLNGTQNPGMRPRLWSLSWAVQLARPQWPAIRQPVGAIGTRNSNSGNWPIGNSIQIQFTQFNEGNSIAVGLAKEAEIDAEAVVRPACLVSG